MTRPMTSKLAVFDLDGTLVDSMATDSDCFVESFRLEFDCRVGDDWSVYKHCTDEGIVTEAFAEHFGRSPTRSEINRFRSRFESLLKMELADRKDPLAEIPGAFAFLAELRRRGWHCCVATGAWLFSAQLKLDAVGIPEQDRPPIFSSDLDSTREGIVRAAVAAMRVENSIESFDRIVAVGDGVWDVRAAFRLGLPLVGVGRGAHALRLSAAGARTVVSDFSDLAAAVAVMESADLPRSPAS